jgi:hypothetical protein
MGCCETFIGLKLKIMAWRPLAPGPFAIHLADFADFPSAIIAAS